MRARPEALARVAARLREELADLAVVVDSLDDALARWGPEPQEAPTVHWLAGLVHDFYTGLEKAFCDISPELNGREQVGETWHRDLLHAMTLDLPEFRPPVIRGELEPPLLELLRFRHVYRNLYSFRLRWDRVRRLAEHVRDLWPDVRSDLTRFVSTLDALARS
ncbi:MAG: hypothetical protein QME96_00570 [Myxococcota bacterium]|nr:hypothetical protein [Myxococcota bacterium]